MKTIEQWLAGHLPQPFSKQALENTRKMSSVVLNDPTPSAHEALYRAFPWVDSPQGHEYWEGIATLLENNQSK